MKSLKKAIGLGFLTWLIPFVVAVAIFPLKKAGDPLFETIMPVVLAFCAVCFVNLYFKHVTCSPIKEGFFVGWIWLGISLALDSIMFSAGPMKMPFVNYIKDIGLSYLIFPVISTGAGFLPRNRIASESQITSAEASAARL